MATAPACSVLTLLDRRAHTRRLSLGCDVLDECLGSGIDSCGLTEVVDDDAVDVAPSGVDTPDEFLAQLTNLSPKAAAAIEATAEEASGRVATDEHDEPADERAPEGDEEINRNLLLKFLSSTKN